MASLGYNEFELDGVRYPLVGAVGQVMISVWPGKVTFGESTLDDDPISSHYSVSDWSGGIGTEVMEGDVNLNSLWFATLDVTHKHHLVLPPRADPVPMPAGTTGVLGIEALAGEIYVVFERANQSAAVYRYNGSSWSGVLYGLTGIFNSIGHITLDNEDYLIIAHSDGVASTSDGVTWNTVRVG